MDKKADVVPYDVTFTIYGEPASKANSRRLVSFGQRIASIKSKKALSYQDAFRMQCRTQVNMLTSADVKVEMLILYASRRPDLDESLILDCMQDIVYLNDRQVKQKKYLLGIKQGSPQNNHQGIEPKLR
jgi:hypothetical protein